MGLFSSSKSSSSSSADSGAPAAPSRSERKACWESRDAYFQCLTSHSIIVPPGTDMSDGRGPVGKSAAEEQKRLEKEKGASRDQALKDDPCRSLRGGYEEHCARSWVSRRSERSELQKRSLLWLLTHTRHYRPPA